MKTIILAIFLLISARSFSQKFYLGEELIPNSKEYKLLCISSETGVHTYQFIGILTDKYFFEREIGDIIVGIKNGIIVTTVYNVIPKPGDVGVPKSIIDLIQSNLPFPLKNINGIYAVNIDNETISISRSNNPLTFHKDRIAFMNTVKQSILRQ